MSDTLNAKIADLSVFLYGGLRSLPFALAGTMLTIGLFTSNYAVLFFLIGLLIIAPTGTWIINRLLPLIINGLQYLVYLILYLLGRPNANSYKPTDFLDLPYFNRNIADVCKLIIPFSSTSESESETVISSPWTAMTAFFIGYVICNSLELYINDITSSATLSTSDLPDTQSKVNKRKSQAMFALVSISIFALIVFAFRYYTGCENWLGMLITVPAFGAIGYYWYKLLSEVGQGRLSDIFGIANRLLVPSAIKNGPIACVPIPAS